ncbi:MAG: hypothetical protein QOI15_593, partial [Pseudonocardiales bacterium]|nr:hypothetical protein [Pseudonocardiales bacterium]
MPHRTAGGAAAAVALAALALVACTSTTAGRGSSALTPTTSGGPTSSATSSSPTPGPGDCHTYAEPDPDRPRMALSFTIAADHQTVVGHEQIVFHPDLPITELVFRLTANTRPSVDEGNGIEVTAASADLGAGRFTFTAANASPLTQGGLLHIPFAEQVPAGTEVTAT